MIAPHVTRLGRFRKRDPRRRQDLPGCARVIGVLAWAAFLAEVLRRAYRGERADTLAGPGRVAKW